MRRGEIEKALSVLLGSRPKAVELMRATSLRHLSEASAKESRARLPPTEARRFQAAFALAKAALSAERAARLSTTSAAYAHFRPYLALRKSERLVVVALDSRFHPLATEVVAEGSPDAVRVRPVDVFLGALRHRASGILVAHNHPSGDMTPSLDDYALTRRLTELGHALGIRLVDHLIVVGTGFWSVLRGDRGTSAKAAKSAPSAY